MAAGLLHQLLCAGRFVEAGVVQHDHTAAVQLGQQHMLDPLIEYLGVARAGKEHGRNQPVIEIAANETGARSLLAVLQAMDLLPPARPAMRAMAAGGKAGFIQAHQRALPETCSPVAQQVFLALKGGCRAEGLLVVQCFFYA